MRNISNIARFFIVCAVVFCIGLVMAVGGAAAGGIKGMEKIAKENKWISEGPGELTSDYMGVDDFDAIETTGDADVVILTEKYFGDSRWMDEHNDLDVESMLAINGTSTPEAGHVLVARGDKTAAPDVRVEDGVLKIDSEKISFEDGISFNFSKAPSQPVVYVFCDDGELSEIKADTFGGDIKVGGVRFKKANIKSDSGDAVMYGVRGGSASFSLKSGDARLSGKFSESADVTTLSGDIDLSGTFKGPTTVTAASGDVTMSGKLLGETTVTVKSGDTDIESELSPEEYSLDLKAASGDIQISEDGNEEEYDDYQAKVQRGDGPNKLKVDSASGDIKIAFSMPSVL